MASILVLAPLPFGAVSGRGRLALESSALVLLLLWTYIGWTRSCRLPPLRVVVLLAGLLLLGVTQTIPVGEDLISVVSPQSLEVRESLVPPEDARAAEEAILQLDPATLDAPPTLSVEPRATASALRTGAALCALLIIAAHVARTRGLKTVVTALFFSAGFQALYGVIVVASGHDQIWNVEKTVFLDAATGTWVNRNHFADYLAMALPCGAALWVTGIPRKRQPHVSWLVRTFSTQGSRNLLLLLTLVTGLAGLLVSMSRAGIGLGVAGVVAALWLCTRSRPPAARLIVVCVVVAIAAVPLIQVGADAFLNRLETSADDFKTPGSRATVWSDTARLARSFPVLGSGFGTFASVYPQFRSPEVRYFYAHAHNDLLQFSAEGGAIGLLLLAALLASLGRRLLGALRGDRGVLSIGVAVGLSAALLHSLIDFNFHLPANAATAVVLAGLLWGLPSESES
ncbi:MAG: hypothetical protein GTN89_05990 [Acidobacteria bacterium]|nr:hypothetical protein [Acidobacteriota bacterium]NIM63209.1 hypothetical protein [Acidobacteriota bacterium]NIO58864.1 hypothetical protein [Acidobacteriota bacterium]NIQ29916.1 hypothetical protein [Acidobacteriota bacterium]NIQ84648.1 hypothetical protein [Acidobacteriota bacterium]